MLTFRQALATLGACALALSLCCSAACAQDQVEKAFAAIRPSLVFVVNFHNGHAVSTGSGFVVGHRDGHMLVVTNRHVVDGGDGFRGVIQFPAQVSFGLTLVTVGTSDDLALLESTERDAPALSLATTLPPLGHAISVAGYPKTQIEIAGNGGGLSPSVHAGNVNALVDDGYYIQYDAQTDHGNSGGPLFDVDSGVVYGVVVLKLGSIETNFAISAVRVRTFLAGANVFPSSTAAIPDSRRPDDSAPIASVPSPAGDPTDKPAAIDWPACKSAMTAFVMFIKQNSASFDQYIDEQNASSESLRAVRDMQSLTGVRTKIATELTAIQVIIRDQEPHLSAFHTRVAHTGAAVTAQAVDKVVTDIATRDQDALQSALEKTYLVGVLLSGGTPDRVAKNYSAATEGMQAQVIRDYQDLAHVGVCKR